MVDEYQDSNMVQEIMISMISKADTDKPNVFMVGDVKQSIYRFRQAKPELFMSKYNSYSKESESPFRKILLFKNFRSRKGVVDAVNFIFKQIMSVSVGELNYTDIEALNAGAVFMEKDTDDQIVGGETEFHLIQTTSNEEQEEIDVDTESVNSSTEDLGQESEEDEEILSNVQCEARLVAKRIHELMLPGENNKSFCVFDKGSKEYRRVEFRDIVILLRTTKNWSDVFLEELSMKGIPAFADTGTGFFKTIEVQVMLSLLQIIDNPLQDIPLLSVLRSPMVCFSTDDLAEMRLIDRKMSLFEALQKLVEYEQSSLSKKAKKFLAKFNNWREMSLYMSTDQLLWRLYNETGYYGMVGAMSAGEQRQANLRVLFERARRFEETSYKGLFNFISFIDKIKVNKGDMGSAKILGENDNVVRIMSIHKSKGLEFPVVILSGCGKKFNLQDMNKSILLHQELGFGPEVVDHKIRLSYPSAPKQAIKEKIKTETLSEEMRILYVALTRAKEKLIITGVVSNIEKSVLKWSNCADIQESKLPEYKMLKSNNYLDWIAPALIRHKNCIDLRNYASKDGNSKSIVSEFAGLLIEDPSVWCVKVWNKSDALNSKVEVEKGEGEFIQWLEGIEASTEDCELFPEIERRLGWNYPYDKISKVPAKVSVTELKRKFDSELLAEVRSFPEFLPSLVKKPMFLEEKKGITAAEAGTVLHFVMQRLDYQLKDIKVQIDEMVTKDLLTVQQAQSVDVIKIRRFLDSPLGIRLLASKSVNREVPFNIEIPCQELYNNMENELYMQETLLLQGVIDCFFEEKDGIILLDYKTDYVPAGKSNSIKDRYKVQIYYYARAIEMLTGKKVKGKYIYLFLNGEVVLLE